MACWRTTFALVMVPGYDGMRDDLGKAIEENLERRLPAGTEVRVTGLDELASQSGGSEEESGVLVETLVGSLGALVVLAFVFGSFLALVPLLVAAFSIIGAFLAIYGSFPLVLAVIGAATFVLLARAFRSLVLAAQAVLMNLLSIGAAYGALVLVWQHGYGSEEIWGLEATGAITGWVPLMTFAFLDRRGGRRGTGEDRTARHQRRADPVPRLRRAGERP